MSASLGPGDGFLAVVSSPRAPGRPPAVAEPGNRCRPGQDPGAPRVRVSGEGWELRCWVCADAQVAADAAGGVRLVLHGEVTEGGGSATASELLDRYRRQGPAALEDLEGHHALLVVDPRAPAPILVTDRWNGRRVFHGRAGGSRWLSTPRTLSLQPLDEVRPSLAGVASYLANGVTIHDRTLFDGVRALSPAAIHSVRPDRVESRVYWRPLPSREHASLPPDRLGELFRQVVLSAVRKRVEDAPAVFLPLTGGYDSSTILGACHRLGVDDLRTFSYVPAAEAGEPPAGTDPAVAREMARSLSVPHHLVPGFADDLWRSILENAPSAGTAQFVMETDAWRAVGERMGSVDGRPAILFGDTVAAAHAGWMCRSPRDVVEQMGIQGMERLAWLRRRLSPERFQALERAAEGDIQSLLDRVPSDLRLVDATQWIYAYRVSRILMPMRELFGGDRAWHRHPFLDHRFVDFIGGLRPAPEEKAFLKQEVERWFPEVYRHPRSTVSGPNFPDWSRDKVTAAEDRLREWIRDESSPFDELVPGQVLLSVLEEERTVSSWARARERWRRRIRRRLEGGGFRTWLGRRLHLAKRRPPVRAHQFVARAAYARWVLAQRTAAGGPAGTWSRPRGS